MLRLTLLSKIVKMTQTSFNRPDDIVYSAQVLEFVAVANELCKFMENCTAFEKPVFVNNSLRLLTYLYLKVLNLPELESEEDGMGEKFVSELDWQAVKDSVQQILVANDVFVDIIEDNYLGDSETTNVSISECYADIYQDIKDFLVSYDLGSPAIMFESLWECRQSFLSRWGVRVLTVMQQLHILNFKPEILDN
jgi:hypothetical protein